MYNGSEETVVNLRIFQIDAFTSEAFGGNPAAVMPLDCWLEDDGLDYVVVDNVPLAGGRPVAGHCHGEQPVRDGIPGATRQ